MDFKHDSYHLNENSDDNIENSSILIGSGMNDNNNYSSLTTTISATDEDDEQQSQSSTILERTYNFKDNQSAIITQDQVELLSNDQLTEEIKDNLLVDDDYKEEIDLDVDKSADVTIVATEKKKTPWWCWVLLISALLAMSSSGPALKMLDAPPLRKASWRLQSTSFILLIGFLTDLHTIYPLWDIHASKAIAGALPLFLVRLLPISWQVFINTIVNTKLPSVSERRTLQSETRAKYFSWKTWAILTGTGIVLGLHFGFWITSLNETSLSHSLLFVTSNPIMIVIVMLVTRKPISKGEIIGCLVGFIGLVITMFDSLFLSSSSSNNGQNPTVFGDFLALLGAVCIVFYLFAGSNLRSWLSLYLYVFPVTFIASLFLTIGSAIIEKMPIPQEGQNFGIFGWMSPAFIWPTLYVAIFPGIIGHTGMNAIIKYIEPVVISVTLLLEPPIGTLMGWAVDAGELPGLFTYIGGPIVVAGCGLVTVSSYRRTKEAIAQSKTNESDNGADENYGDDKDNLLKKDNHQVELETIKVENI